MSHDHPGSNDPVAVVIDENHESNLSERAIKKLEEAGATVIRLGNAAQYANFVAEYLGKELDEVKKKQSVKQKSDNFKLKTMPFDKLRPIAMKVNRTGRNQPCPCGSGKKYKNCHGGGYTLDRFTYPLLHDTVVPDYRDASGTNTPTIETIPEAAAQDAA